MFDNLGWWEIALLVMLAFFIFGPDRLPHAVRDAARFLRRVRQMARNATEDLRGELGPDLDIADLHPKRFIRRHLLTDEDEELLRRPFDEVWGDQAYLKEITQWKWSDSEPSADLPRVDPDTT